MAGRQTQTCELRLGDSLHLASRRILDLWATVQTLNCVLQCSCHKKATNPMYQWNVPLQRRELVQDICTHINAQRYLCRQNYTVRQQHPPLLRLPTPSSRKTASHSRIPPPHRPAPPAFFFLLAKPPSDDRVNPLLTLPPSSQPPPSPY